MTSLFFNKLAYIKLLHYLAFCCLTFFTLPLASARAEIKIISTTFPIHQLVRNVTKDIKNIKISLLLPGDTGCPHNYQLRPKELQKLSSADVLITNGLNLDSFISKAALKINPNIKIIDTSKGIEKRDYIKNWHHHLKHMVKGEYNNHYLDQESNINPHLFTSPKRSAKLVRYIASELSKIDDRQKLLYQKNSAYYANILDELATRIKDSVSNLKNKKIVTQHGIFDYFAKDTGLEVVTVIENHSKHHSARNLLEVSSAIKSQNVGAIFTEPQYSPKTGEILAKETKTPIATLDPCASGPKNAPLDFFETTMANNLKTLEQTLGTR